MKQLQQLSTRRLEALTDGVFAIAMTLLVLDLVVPVGAQVGSSTDLWKVLGSLRSSFVSLTISFFVLAIMWAIHARQFEHIKQMDSRVVNLNMLRLFLVVLIPFTTSLVGDYDYVPLAIVLYPFNLLLLATVTYVQGTYLDHRPSYFTTFDKQAVAAGNRRSQVFMFTTLAITIGSVFINQYAYFGFFLLPFINHLVSKHS